MKCPARPGFSDSGSLTCTFVQAYSKHNTDKSVWQRGTLKCVNMLIGGKTAFWGRYRKDQLLPSGDSYMHYKDTEGIASFME